MKCSLCSLALIFSLLAGRVDATLVAYDAFLTGTDRAAGQYATGNVTISNTAILGWPAPPPNVAGSTAYSGTTSNYQIEAGASQNSPLVDYDTEVTPGGAQGQLNWIGASGDFNRNVIRNLSPIPSSNQWWMSIMVNRTGAAWANTGTANNRFVVGGFANALDSLNGLAIGYSNVSGDGVPDLVLRSNYNVLTTLIPDAPGNTVQFVIVKLIVDPVGLAANDEVSVWVNPTNVSSVAALGAPLVTMMQDVANSLTPFTASRFVSLGVSGVAKFDELRLATRFGGLFVVPEPCG